MIIVPVFFALVISGGIVAAVLTFNSVHSLRTADRGSFEGAREQIGSQALHILQPSSDEELERKLAVVGKSVEVFFYEKTLASLGLLGVGFGILSFSFTLFVAFLIALGFGVFGWFLPKMLLDSEVSQAKYAMRQAVMVYQELAAAAIAGGSDTHTALRKAADYGDGQPWRRLRETVRYSLTSEKGFSHELYELSALYQLAELENLANLVYSSEQGATAQTSLEEMAAQQSELASQEAIEMAEKSTSRLIIPIGLLFISFMLFILFAVFNSIDILDI